VGWDAFHYRLVTFGKGLDYWEHTATLRALLDDPWHPPNPQLVSPATSPRFGPHYIAIAVFGRLLGLDAVQAAGVAAVTNVALFLAGIAVFFRLYFRDARASLYGLIVMLAGWWRAWDYSNVYQLRVMFDVASYPSMAA